MSTWAQVGVLQDGEDRPIPSLPEAGRPAGGTEARLMSSKEPVVCNLGSLWSLGRGKVHVLGWLGGPVLGDKGVEGLSWAPPDSSLSSGATHCHRTPPQRSAAGRRLEVVRRRLGCRVNECGQGLVPPHGKELPRCLLERTSLHAHWHTHMLTHAHIQAYTCTLAHMHTHVHTCAQTTRV